MSELKPCPFCGSRNVAQGASRERISVWCFCGAQGPDVAFPENCIEPEKPIKECYELWNHRAAPVPPVVGEDAVERLTDAELSGRLRDLATEVFPSANQYGIADSVRRLVSIFERLTPEDYALIYRSIYPPRTDRFDDGQPDEMQEWHDYDADC